jgi:hypothetical protein
MRCLGLWVVSGGPRWHRQTSYFERLARDHPDGLRAGLVRLRAGLAAGRAPHTPGVASVLAYEQGDIV